MACREIQTNRNNKSIILYARRGQSAFSRCASLAEPFIKLISLTQGYFAIVDTEDYNWLINWKWHIATRTRKGRKEIVGACHTDSKSKKIILMHRKIMSPPDNMQIDHIDHNVLDNRRINLRICTNSENSQNRFTKTHTSKYKGVHYRKTNQKYCAQIQRHQRQLYIGCFEIELEAAKAYDKKAVELYGEFALTNFPEGAKRCA